MRAEALQREVNASTACASVCVCACTHGHTLSTFPSLLSHLFPIHRPLLSFLLVLFLLLFPSSTINPPPFHPHRIKPFQILPARRKKQSFVARREGGSQFASKNGAGHVPFSLCITWATEINSNAPVLEKEQFPKYLMV